MKIYFTASLSAKDDHPEIEDIYKSIVAKLRELGHKVTGEHVLKTQYLDVKGSSDTERVAYYQKMLKNINQSDVVVAETSYSSASIGHELSLALEKNKPIVLISKEGRVPQIYKAMREHDIYIVEYIKIDELLDRLDDELARVKEGEDIRFNFLVPPYMVDYLEWVSKKRRIPKSVFLRDLINREMEADEEYLS